MVTKRHSHSPELQFNVISRTHPFVNVYLFISIYTQVQSDPEW